MNQYKLPMYSHLQSNEPEKKLSHHFTNFVS